MLWTQEIFRYWSLRLFSSWCIRVADLDFKKIGNGPSVIQKVDGLITAHQTPLSGFSTSHFSILRDSRLEIVNENCSVSGNTSLNYFEKGLNEFYLFTRDYNMVVRAVATMISTMHKNLTHRFSQCAEIWNKCSKIQSYSSQSQRWDCGSIKDMHFLNNLNHMQQLFRMLFLAKLQRIPVWMLLSYHCFLCGDLVTLNVIGWHHKGVAMHETYKPFIDFLQCIVRQPSPQYIACQFRPCNV